MMQSWKKNTSEYEASAKVVDGNLILSLPDAVNPVVWRMELGSVKASALEVRTQGDGNHMLLLKTPKGDIHEIAPFAARDTAVHALMRVSAALQGAEGKIVPQASAASSAAAPSRAQNGESTSWKWIVALAGVVVVIVLYAMLGSMEPPTTLTDVAEPTAAADGQSGVPESADKALKGF